MLKMMMMMIDGDFFLPYQQVTKYLKIFFFQLVLFHRIFVFDLVDLYKKKKKLLY